jgi:hypothetical protein
VVDVLRPIVLDVLEALPDVAMMAYDRHLDVIGSTQRAQALHPIYMPGTNLARFAYLSRKTNRDLQDWEQKADLIASALRSSLSRHPEDDAFLDLVGELTARSDVFARSWASSTANPGLTAILIRHPEVGELRLNQRQLPLGGGSEDTLVVWTGADQDSASKLASLVGSEPY